jgi:VanZ family protein
VTEARERGENRGMPLLLSWAGFIAVSLLAPLEAVPFVGPGNVWGLDKAGHVALFFVLGALAIGPMRVRSRRPVLAVLAGSVLYGGLLEVLQGALGWRSAELLDLVANGVGSAAGVAAALLRRPA